MKRSWRYTAIGLFSLALVAGGFFGNRLQALTDEARESMRLYSELITVAHDQYGGDVTYRDLVYASINGMVRTLDPHTSFLPPRAYSGMRERQQSSFYGLGIQVGMRNGRVTVIVPIEGGPAHRLGIRAGDIIDTINGESTADKGIDDAVGKLKGPKNSPVDITLLRRGVDKPIPMTVIRDEIPQTTVRFSYMLTPEVGYMRISDFNRATGKEVAKAVEKLKDQGMQKLLLDLRNNGGGLLDQAILVGDQFVPDNSKIVETRGRTRNSYQTYFAEGRYDDLDMPVVVLVNSGTASAAEILAGAIQDHDVGIVAGTPTWGKGLVQTVYTLSYGAGLALTTAKYYTPSGRLIQRDYTSYYDYYNYDGLDDDGNVQVDGDTAGEEERPGGQSSEDEFSTDLGRRVFGGGGISPDVIMPPDQISSFLQLLHLRNAFFDFAVDYQGRNPIGSTDWKPKESILSEFRDWVVTEEGLGDSEELGFEDETTREYVLRQLRAEVFNAAFGQEEWNRVLAGGDSQIQEAMGLFSDAEALLARRKELQKEIDQQAALEKN